jgi:hypothetical protein
MQLTDHCLQKSATRKILRKQIRLHFGLAEWLYMYVEFTNDTATGTCTQSWSFCNYTFAMTASTPVLTTVNLLYQRWHPVYQHMTSKLHSS